MSLSNDSIRVTQTGTTVGATISASSGTQLPQAADGTEPRFVRVLAETGTAYIKFGTGSSVAASLNDALVSASFPTVFSVRGMSYFSVIARTGTVEVNVLTLDN